MKYSQIYIPSKLPKLQLLLLLFWVWGSYCMSWHGYINTQRKRQPSSTPLILGGSRRGHSHWARDKHSWLVASQSQRPRHGDNEPLTLTFTHLRANWSYPSTPRVFGLWEEARGPTESQNSNVPTSFFKFVWHERCQREEKEPAKRDGKESWPARKPKGCWYFHDWL